MHERIKGKTLIARPTPGCWVLTPRRVPHIVERGA